MIINQENLKAALIGAAIGLALHFLVGCSPQQSAQYMPLMSYGTSMTSQAANMYWTNQRMQQQAELQRQQQEYLYLQQQRQNQY